MYTPVWERRLIKADELIRKIECRVRFDKVDLEDYVDNARVEESWLKYNDNE